MWAPSIFTFIILISLWNRPLMIYIAIKFQAWCMWVNDFDCATAREFRGELTQSGKSQILCFWRLGLDRYSNKDMQRYDFARSTQFPSCQMPSRRSYLSSLKDSFTFQVHLPKLPLLEGIVSAGESISFRAQSGHVRYKHMQNTEEKKKC